MLQSSALHPHPATLLPPPAVPADPVAAFAEAVVLALEQCRMRNSDMSLGTPFTARALPEQRVLFGMPVEVTGEVDGHGVTTALWVGLNVRRVFTIYFVQLSERIAGRHKNCHPALVDWLRTDVYHFTFGGAEKVGYNPFFQFFDRQDQSFVSIWLTAMAPAAILPGEPEWQFWAQDVAMQTLSFMQATWTAGLPLRPPFTPSPL